ncbi:MAG TPA: hypothetical protein VIR09_12115, partial [Achromobacter sp.]
MRRTLPSHPSRPFLGALLALGLLLQACTLPTRHAYQKDTAMPEPTTLSPRLQQLFAKTKRVCVGRYALEVPKEAEVRWGPSGFPSEIEVIHGGVEAANKRVVRDITKIKEKNQTAEIISNQSGPVPNSWQLRECPNFRVQGAETFPRRRSALATNRPTRWESRFSILRDSSGETVSI